MSYDGKQITTPKYVSLHQEINVTCEALKARPKANVTWINTEGSTVNTVVSSILSTGTLFSTVSMLTFSMTDESIDLDCVISLKEANFTQTIHGTFNIYVLPKLQLIINGETVSNGSIFPINDVAYQITCNALKARPTAFLSWTRNKLPFDDRIIPVDYIRNTNTNSTVSTFMYKPIENETVSCISRLGEISVTEEVSARFLSYDNNEDKIPILLWMIPSASAIALILLLCLVCVPYVFVKRMRAYLSTNIAE
ncbi:hypothetical protein HOLleu_13822 [Holothuria leucospilota]|uniref:Ig-like domain-containing protein n=1 Tax=Holothuria leucospilota TaxID=206669 RepID=A0A9Q1C7C4_HOLLE|nr:hypothetical protein HOLleu_13822 [Holothuria leucospilota]